MGFKGSGVGSGGGDASGEGDGVGATPPSQSGNSPQAGKIKSKMVHISFFMAFRCS